MLHLTAPKNNRGFTLIENLIILVILGVLTAITVPSIVGVYNRQQLNYSVNLVRGALQEAQREAMRQGKQCSVEIKSTMLTSPDGCLLSNRELPSVVTIYPPTTAQFGIRGNFQLKSSPSSNLVISLEAENVNEKQCVEVSYPLGMIRTGIYKNDECQKKP